MSTAAKSVTRVEGQATPATSGFIIGPVADSVLIIGAPVVALVVATPLFALPDSLFSQPILGRTQDLRQVFVTAFIAAHLFLVYFRSHLNGDIFRTHPIRFTVVPVALLVSTALFPLVMGLVGVLSIWWDVYHSSLQTFGFGRIYDAKLKNSPTAGRRLDYWMNLFLYTGPVLAGAHFLDHIELSRGHLLFLATDRSAVSDLLYRQTPTFLLANQSYLATGVLAFGIPFLAYYIYGYARLQRQGYRVSWQKVWLYVITGSVSVYAWGFRSFVDGFWVMNFFHALQYFAIVSFMEQRNIVKLFRVDGLPFGKALAIGWVMTVCLLYGLWAGYYATGAWMGALILTTAIMHFWYDGFIWSVKKKQV